MNGISFKNSFIGISEMVTVIHMSNTITMPMNNTITKCM